MPLNIDDSTPIKFPNPEYQTLENWKRGVITLIDQSRLPKNALKIADNLFLREDGMPSPRPGTNWFGTAPTNAEIEGFDYFDFNGSIHLLIAAGGSIYRSADDGQTWAICTGANYTVGHTVRFNQNSNFSYITTGVDNISRYDGSTVLQTYTTLATPLAATAAKTGLVANTYSYWYKISAVSEVGFSAASLPVVLQTSAVRTGWDRTSNFVTLTFPALQVSQTRYDIYISEDNLHYYYLDSTAGTSYQDDGSAIVIPSTNAPLANTTQGPKVEELTNVGSRMFGVRDHDNRYRISFTSGNANLTGAFSNAYDGGYLDWQPGGKYIPTRVEDYRDGKGTPLATIWCKSADGQGCILQMSLDTLTVGSLSITVPSAYKLPGSRGTAAPDSVVNVLNDYMFYNSQAFYNLGSRAQFLNLLSTDESSANIRPTVRTISTAGESKIAAVYFLAKVYFSVPYGSTQNNATAIYDTEMKAWLPTAFTIGFKRFLRYTDSTGTPRLLAVKPGDYQLTEISDSIQGDYGVPFITNLVTGLYPTNKNRFEFQWTEEGEVEFSNPQGTIDVELTGYERTNGFSTIASEAVTSNTIVSSSGAGWDNFGWDAKPWDDTSKLPVVSSEPSVKRYFIIQKELNAVQWHISTNGLDARYVLRTLQSWGTPTQGGKPRQWRLSQQTPAPVSVLPVIVVPPTAGKYGDNYGTATYS